MGTRDAKVDAYIQKSPAFAQPILLHLREIIHKACPTVEEKMKWSFPHFDYKGMMCSMAAMKEYCVLSFWKASLMADSHKVFASVEEKAMGNLGKIKTVKDLPAEKVLIAYVKEAMQLNDTGVKLPSRTKTITADITVPEDFEKMLKKNKAAAGNFAAFTPGKKKEYLGWFDEAKTADTRNKRMETAIEWIAENKIRNWKYEKK